MYFSNENKRIWIEGEEGLLGPACPLPLEALVGSRIAHDQERDKHKL